MFQPLKEEVLREGSGNAWMGPLSPIKDVLVVARSSTVGKVQQPHAGLLTAWPRDQVQTESAEYAQ